MTKERFSTIVQSLDFDRLTEWELGFLESCEARLDDGWELSEWQGNKVEEISGAY